MEVLTPPQTPQGELQYAPATRAAAAALANERLAPDLRSRDYAVRFGAAGGSSFARRITGAATQGARDELAQTRAYAVRVAQTPPDRRPPVAPARRRSAAGKRIDGPVLHPVNGGQGNGPVPDAPARSSRAPSSTILQLRRRQLADAQRRDPIPRDPPPPAWRERPADALGCTLTPKASREPDDEEGEPR
jgi:hypothetical protein